MKLLAAILLVCLLVTGMVSAISMNPGSVGAVKMIVTTTQVPKIPASIQPAAVATEEGFILVNIDSVPSGAKVTTDGYTTPDATTPFKQALHPGTHTFVLSHTLYQDYTVTLELKAGMPSQYITAELKRLDISPVMERVTVSFATPQPGNAFGGTSPEPPGRPTSQATLVRALDHIPGMVTLVTTTPAPVSCPNSDWTCLTDAEAQQQFGYPNARYGDQACGYAQEGNQMVAKYCYMDVNTGTLPAGALAAAGIKEGDDIYILNATLIEHAVVNKSPAQRKVANNIPWQSFFDFFSNFLSGSAKPESRLEIVGFNPCPEPPGMPNPVRLK